MRAFRERPQWRAVSLLCATACFACETPAEHEQSPLAAQVAWLQEHAVPLATADPDVPEEALAVLRETIGGARLVGLGEATHGTAEFWQIRQKITRYLVEEMGFQAILFEAPLPNGLHIDRYVTEGIGTAEEAHRRLGYWRYQEMRDLIEWVRDYNLQRAPSDPPLRFLGYDCAYIAWTEASLLIAEYLTVVDPTVVDEVTARLDNYTLADAQYVVDLFTTHADDYAAVSGADEHALMLRIAESLIPSWTVWDNMDRGVPTEDVRESFNVETVEWIVEHMLDGGKAIIWAHNGHVGDAYLPDAGTESQMLGSRLKERYGDAYYVIGTEFFGGRFLAWDVCSGTYTAFVEHSAAMPLTISYTHRFHQAGIPLFYLDLNAVDYSRSESAWLTGPLLIRFIGAEYCAAQDGAFYLPVSLPEWYDGIVHFETTTPTTRITFGE
ncbi:MAG: erythromycin esterase family protein [Gemmatimonadales bacterium]|nr:erythromycin esterase family protein [Gemmatimonadales bacterium]